jgi:3-oxoadipate enol-lactonase/4-carboxymuconolactone decarboxylase
MQARILNDRLIAYRHRTGGGGPCVVFANSLGSDQSLWDGVIEDLPRGFDTLTYDLRGHGLSGLSEGYRVPDMADDLIALIEALGLSDVILCGVSVGGMISQSVAARRPDLLRAVILSNTAPRIGDAARWNDRIAAVEKGGVESIADAILENWFAPAFRSIDPARWQLCRVMLCRTPAAGYAATCAAIRDSDLRADAAAIAVPVLCLGGAEDRSVPPDAVAALAAAIPGARLEILDGVGHLPAIEAPARVAALIEQAADAPAPRSHTGMAVRRGVLGDAHVDRAEAAKTAFDEPFQTLITEGAWGTVWASPGIARRERSMLTLALLAAMGNFDEIPMHVRATLRTGATPRDIQEAFQHVAIYAGVPRANHALKLARQTFAELENTDDRAPDRPA